MACMLVCVRCAAVRGGSAAGRVCPGDEGNPCRPRPRRARRHRGGRALPPKVTRERVRRALRPGQAEEHRLDAPLVPRIVGGLEQPIQRAPPADPVAPVPESLAVDKCPPSPRSARSPPARGRGAGKAWDGVVVEGVPGSRAGRRVVAGDHAAEVSWPRTT